MKLVFILSVYVCTVICQDANQMEKLPKYDDRYDYLDIDAIFTNKRLIRNYVDCLINSNRCTPEGKQLKRLLPEALRTKCVRCTERQKKTAVKIIKRLKYEFPDEWAKLATRWDPTGDFTRYFEEYLAKEHLNTIPGSGTTSPAPTTRPVVIPERRGPSFPNPTYLPPPPVPLSPAAGPPAAADPMPEPAAMPVTQPTMMPVATTMRPMIMNRFGDDGEMMMTSPSSAAGTTRPTTMKVSSMRPAMPPKPTPITWNAGASNAIPTRFPLRPPTDLPPPYSTAITLIDQIGYKIIRTTELVTDLLRNSVRAIVG